MMLKMAALKTWKTLHEYVSDEVLIHNARPATLRKRTREWSGRVILAMGN